MRDEISGGALRRLKARALAGGIGLVFAGVLFAGALPAQAASIGELGTIEFWPYVSFAKKAPHTKDLGGVSPLADAPVRINPYSYNWKLPGGLPAGYAAEMTRLIIGDHDRATADLVDDSILFRIDPTTTIGATPIPASVSLIVNHGKYIGIDNIVFSLFETDATGAPLGAPIYSLDNAGTSTFVDFNASPGMAYLVHIVGNLRADIANTFANTNATFFGHYDLAIASLPSVVPLPPALLLFGTALAGLAGFGRIKRRRRAEA